MNKGARVIQVGNFVNTGNWDNPQRGRVYSPEGIAPTVNTGSGGGHTAQIIVRGDSDERTSKSN